MKYIYLLILVLSIGCASNTTQKENAPPEAREPAGSSAENTSAFMTSLFSSVYQGPIPVNVDGSSRVPAKSFLPVQYDDKKSWPLAVMLHGFSGTAETEDFYLGLRFRVSLRGFILLAPEGTKMPAGTKSADGKDLGGIQFWNATDACCDFGKTGVDDVAYLRLLIEKMKSKYNIDPKQVYIIGHSNGGFMANRLACEMGPSFGGIANLAGGSDKDPKKCSTPTPIPYLQIHAVDDKTIVYQNSADYAGGKETVAAWVEKNGCINPPLKGEDRDFLFLIPGPETTEQNWKQCTSKKEVAFWTIKQFETKGHSPHIPLFNLKFTDAVLDFLFKQK